MTLYECFFRLLTALICGTVIGTERQARNHTSGLRTTILISLGAALFCLPVEILSNADPSRVPAGIVSGVGFIASAYIFKDSSSVQITGLATAATMFASAALGTLCGLGFWTYAIVGVCFVLFTNIVFRKKKV